MRVLLGVLLPLLMLAGCSSTPDEGVPVSGATRIVTDAFGPVRVPAEPRRVVVVAGQEFLEVVLGVGLLPVAASRPSTAGAWSDAVAARLPADLADLGPEDLVGPEAVLAQHPDLVVVDENGTDLRAAVSPAVPTIALPQDPVRWRDTLRDFGRDLGRGEIADRVLADYDTAVASARARLGAAPGTASVVRVRADALRYQTVDGSFTWTVLKDLGFVAPASQERGSPERGFVEVGSERLTDVDAGLILVLTDPGAPRLADQQLASRLVGRQLESPSSDALFGGVVTATALADRLGRDAA